jgi:hypothetical protein
MQVAVREDPTNLLAHCRRIRSPGHTYSLPGTRKNSNRREHSVGPMQKTDTKNGLSPIFLYYYDAVGELSVPGSVLCGVAGTSGGERPRSAVKLKPSARLYDILFLLLPECKRPYR